jgi:hypothetical protein
MSGDVLPAEILLGNRLLTAAEFQRLADVPPEHEWFANLTNPLHEACYQNTIYDFMRFAGIARPEEFRAVTRARIIAWRDELRTRLTRRGTPWNDASIRHRLSALAALFETIRSRASNGRRRKPVRLPVPYLGPHRFRANRVAVLGVQEGWGPGYVRAAYRQWFGMA